MGPGAAEGQERKMVDLGAQELKIAAVLRSMRVGSRPRVIDCLGREIAVSSACWKKQTRGLRY